MLGQDHSSIGALVRDIMALATSFISCKRYHVSSLCIRAAHVLAKSVEHMVSVMCG